MCLSLYFTSQHLFVRRPIYLSEHILGNREVRAHIAHSAHILLIQFREIALSQKKKKKRLSLFCHSASQVTFTANNLTSWEKKMPQRKQTNQNIIYNTMNAV